METLDKQHSETLEQFEKLKNECEFVSFQLKHASETCYKAYRDFLAFKQENHILSKAEMLQGVTELLDFICMYTEEKIKLKEFEKLEVKLEKINLMAKELYLTINSLDLLI